MFGEQPFQVDGIGEQHLYAGVRGTQVVGANARSISTAACRPQPASRCSMAVVTEPVPGLSSITTGSPTEGTTLAIWVASCEELGATAPTVPGLRSTAARKAQRCRGSNGMSESLPLKAPNCDIDLHQSLSTSPEGMD
jgi:hypothetical protein